MSTSHRTHLPHGFAASAALLVIRDLFFYLLTVICFLFLNVTLCSVSEDNSTWITSPMDEHLHLNHYRRYYSSTHPAWIPSMDTHTVFVSLVFFVLFLVFILTGCFTFSTNELSPYHMLLYSSNGLGIDHLTGSTKVITKDFLSIHLAQHPVLLLVRLGLHPSHYLSLINVT